MKKISILVEKNLPAGQKANIAAIIMGQLALFKPEVYSKNPVKDSDGLIHAGITENIVILDAGTNQLLTLSAQLKSYDSQLFFIAFSKIGQSLSNDFGEYNNILSLSSTEAVGIIGLGVYGDYEIIKPLTKKFSVTH